MAGRAQVKGWLQAALACAIAGSAVPGLGPAARIVVLAGLVVAAAACLDSAWKGTFAPCPRRAYFAAFSFVLVAWLVVMIYGCFLCILTMPYYRTLGHRRGADRARRRRSSAGRPSARPTRGEGW